MISSISPAFTGVSSYANDLQAVITRAVSIASLPLTLLQNQLQDMTGQSTALNDLNTAFAALQSNLSNFDNAIGAKSLTVATSDPAALSASVSASALPGEYTLNVSSIGSSTATISASDLPAVTDPYATSISGAQTYSLIVNGKTTTITPTGSSLISLAQALNSAAAGVRASVINTGSSTQPEYRLAIRSAALGPDSIQLNDGSQDLLDTLSTGEAARYTVDGLSNEIESTSRTIALAPGLAVNLLQPTAADHPVTVSVSRSMDAAKSVLTDFVAAYNAAIEALDKQVGADAGQLSGEPIIRSLFSTLRQIMQYSSGSGAVRSLQDLGVTLDNQGKLSFDETKFGSVDVDNDNIDAFLGTTLTGGFLKAAQDAINSAEDPVSGSLNLAIQHVKNDITAQNKLIADNQQRISALQANLQERMAAADALLASMETQKNFLNNLFTALINNNNGTTGVKSS